MQGHAHSLLAFIRRPIREAIQVNVADSFGILEIHLIPPGGAPKPSSAWLLLSPIETLIIDRLRRYRQEHPQAVVLGKNLEMLTGQAGAKLRILVRNLVDRGILAHDDEAGYSVAAGGPLSELT